MGLLETNGLSLEILSNLSYKSQLGKSLKNNLNAFEKERLLQDALTATEWFDENELLAEVALDYRVKSEESIRSKYERYYPDRPVLKVLNDLLGFRSLCGSYEEALNLDVLESQLWICLWAKLMMMGIEAFIFIIKRIISIIRLRFNLIHF